MGILARSATVLAIVAFVSGFLITTISGSARAVKIYLALLGGLAIVAAIIALVFTKGLFVYLLFQFISVVIILCFVIIAGAVCGGGVYVLNHKKPPGRKIDQQNIHDFLTVAEFISKAGISEERAVSRIKSGYYDGGILDGTWYVHKSELGSHT
jgi:hypothetical protein